MAPREVIVSFAEVFTRVRVFLGPDYVERTELDGTDLARRRVFFDEVRLLTLHRERRWIPIAVAVPLAVVWSAAAAAMPDDPAALRWVFVALAALAVVLGVALALVPRHVVTVSGLRARLRVLFPSAARARAFYERLGDEVAAAGDPRPAGVIEVEEGKSPLTPLS